MKRYIPNLLTCFRILAVPLIAILLYIGNQNMIALAFIIFTVAAITDFFDGYFARKWNVVSPLGRMLDPIADKLLVGVLLLSLAQTPILEGYNLYAGLIILFREIFVSGLREGLAGKTIIHVSFIAKVKTTLQLIAIGVSLLALTGWIDIIYAQILLWIAAILTLYTGIEYFLNSINILKQE